MASERHPITYTCDMCGSGPWSESEVAGVRVSFFRPPRWGGKDADLKKFLAQANLDLCKKCLESPRVPNSSPSFDNTVSIRDSYQAKPVAMGLLKKLFYKEVKDV